MGFEVLKMFGEKFQESPAFPDVIMHGTCYCFDTLGAVYYSAQPFGKKILNSQGKN